MLHIVLSGVATGTAEKEIKEMGTALSSHLPKIITEETARYNHIITRLGCAKYVRDERVETDLRPEISSVALTRLFTFTNYIYEQYLLFNITLRSGALLPSNYSFHGKERNK